MLKIKPLQAAFLLWSKGHEFALHKQKYIGSGVMLIFAFLLFWHVRGTHEFSLRVIVAYMIYVGLCMSYGRCLPMLLSCQVGNNIKTPFQFLIGYFVFNTLLFFLVLISPFCIYTNLSLLVVFSFFLEFLYKKRVSNSSIDEQQDSPAVLLSIVVSGLGATIWCLDAQSSTVLNEDTSIFRVWQDVFFHVREISIFAQAHGIASMSDIKMSGEAASLYHYGIYVSAAVISALTGSTAIGVYTGFLLPLGIFLTGFSAFVLIASIWGVWPALASTVAVVLLPDAYQQGFGNKYLSYNFLAQVNLGMLYGIACATLAWLFILDGCSRGKYKSIFFGYGFSLIILIYKAHIFVANSFLILIYPCFFFTALAVRWRFILGVIFTVVFVVAVGLSQNFDSIPVLRLDGSGVGYYIVDLFRFYDPGLLKDFFNQVLLQKHYSKVISGLIFAGVLSVLTFGLWLIALLVVSASSLRRIGLDVFCFPFFVILNYLVMSIGLALDTHGIGASDELLNRPLVWAYFVIVVWTAGCWYYLKFGDGLPNSGVGKISLMILGGSILSGTVVFAKNLQTFPTMQGRAKYEDFNSVPVCLVRAANFIRENSRVDEVIQDSENDSHFIVTALSERQDFAVKSMFSNKEPPMLRKRLNELEDFKQMNKTEEIMSYAAEKNISWYLLHPNDQISWPLSLIEKSVFDCDGYRVYHFAID